MTAQPAALSLAGRVALKSVGALVAAVFMVVLVLGSWGLEDWRGYFANPARTLALAALVLRALSLPWYPAAAPRNRALAGKRVAEPFFFAPIFAGALMSLLSPYFDRRGLLTFPWPEGMRYVGACVFLVGLIVASWAQWKMGRLFSGYLIIQRGHHLITDGPFAWVRHPRYAGLILVFTGYPIIFRSITGALGGLMCAIMFFIRIPREEALLAGEFKQEWKAYASKTARLFPGVY